MKKATIHPATVAAKTLKEPPKSCGVLWREARKLAAATPPHCGVVAEDRNSFPPLAAARFVSDCLKTKILAAAKAVKTGQSKRGEKLLSAIKTTAIATPCADMSQVCLSSRPKWTTTGNLSYFPSLKVFHRTPLGVRWAAATFLLSVLLGTMSSAETWSSVSTQTNWQARTSFVREFSAPVTSRAVTLAGTAKLDQLLSLIAMAEANNGYDSVQHGAVVKPPAKPTSMTIRQVYAWIDATPGQPHAIGRYQFIPSTLRDLVRQLGVPTSAKFDRRVQDRLALALVAQAGYSDFASSKITSSKFMDNLALIWAGLPKADGRSAYHGYAGNRATITRTRYAQLFAGIFS